MRRFRQAVAVCAALALLTAAGPSAAAVNFNAFGIAMLQRLAAQSPKDNVFISPASVGLGMAMAAEGAAGSTRPAIVRGLQTGDNLSEGSAAFIAELHQNQDARIGLADAIWTRIDVPPAPAYVNVLKEKYGAEARNVHFGDPSAAQAINDWTKAHTLGLIDRLVDDTSPADFAYLTNAISFDAKWTLPFKKSNTAPGTFAPASGAGEHVQMMHQTAVFQTSDAAAFRTLRMTYGKGGFAAYVLLPTSGSVDALSKSLTAGGFRRLVSGLHPESLAVAMPRFTARYKSSLNGVLQALGMGVAFSDAADFSVVHRPPPTLTITKVDHAAYVRVDEAGTVAAAATSVGVSMTSIFSGSAKPFVVDRPFIFAIRDERSGNLLFIGVIRTV